MPEHLLIIFIPAGVALILFKIKRNAIILADIAQFAFFCLYLQRVYCVKVCNKFFITIILLFFKRVWTALNARSFPKTLIKSKHYDA